MLRREPDLVAEEADGVGADRRADRRVDAREALAHDLEHLGRRDAPAVDELRLEAAALHLLRDLRAGAVHDADAGAGRAQLGDCLRDAARRRAAHFEHDDAHVR